jgi:hypothetical protein
MSNIGNPVPDQLLTPQEHIDAAFSEFAPGHYVLRGELHAAVGPGKANRPEDVRLVQRLLDRQAARTGIVVRETGQFDRSTRNALEVFEHRVMRAPFVRATVEPRSEIFRQLASTTAQRLMAGGAGGLRLPPRTGPAKLTEDDLVAAAAKLNCEVRAIKAVTKQEAPKGPFDRFDRPPILYERHLFHRFTFGIHDRIAPDLSNPLQGGYGLDSAQYGRLQRAYALDATAALRATSWGAFQILGDESAESGFGTVDLFVDAMCQSAQEQLRAFVALIKSRPALTRALQQKQWAEFSRMYNGKTYWKNHYDTNLEKYYEEATP